MLHDCGVSVSKSPSMTEQNLGMTLRKIMGGGEKKVKSVSAQCERKQSHLYWFLFDENSL